MHLVTPDDASVPLDGAVAVPFDALPTAHLAIDRTYRGGEAGHAGDDPLGRLLPVGNQGGFRYHGGRGNLRLVVLYTSLTDPDWPDRLDPETGRFVYYGDNKRPGKELHDTPRGGNAILRDVFGALHDTPPRRNDVPPILIFSKGRNGRDCIFRGLAAPGARSVHPTEDLVAIWKTKDGARFQNYEALFTILDVATVPRGWIADIVAGNSLSTACPDAWRHWVATGGYRPLIAPRVVEYRRRLDQLPHGNGAKEIVAAIRKHFEQDPHAFERCAVELAKLIQNIIAVELTRKSADGGRDAIGCYRIGPISDPIRIDFALEAKCYAASTSVGVRDIARLISRLRHRQFGVFVTTSFVAEQAYREVREDKHPVVIISAEDIVQILALKGITTRSGTEAWLDAEFPRGTPMML